MSCTLTAPIRREMAMDRIISIIRENSQLYALKVRQTGDFAIPVIVEDSEKAPSLPEYYIVKTPLEEIPESLLPHKKRLLASWAELSHYQASDSEALRHLLTVLLETRASFSEGGMPLPDLVPTAQEQTFRATAAHPRAYKGTKTRPPKLRQPEPVDLRPYMDTAHNQNRLIGDSSTHLQKVLELLCQEGYDRERLNFILSAPVRVEPYLAYHHGITDGAAPEMPALFSSHLLPLLKALSIEVVKTYLSLFHGLALHEMPDVLPVFLALVSLEPGKFISGWAKLIAAQTMERQAELACYLIESGITEHSPEIFTASDLARFNSMTSEDVYSHRLYYLFSALLEGSSKEYLFSGFHLANSFNPHFRFSDIGDCRDFPLEQVEELALYLDSDNPDIICPGRYYSMSIWESCGRLKGLQMMRVKILQTKLDLLEHIARKNLAAGISVDSLAPDLEHALQMINTSNDNRRAFRRFLKALLEGNDKYILTHPLTLRWISKHPALNIELWSNGICISERLEDMGSVTLSVERDPLEALKLGTHVGSCLGLGGGLTYSALAVVLDFNKQVIYARDDRGRMLARQLVAISEDDRLVCFEVYPLSAYRRLKQLFREYDRRFAEALGIPLYIDSIEDEYSIVRILSERWWDDRPWQDEWDESAEKARNEAQ